MIVNAEVTVLIAAVMNSTIITARKHLCIIVANRARMIVIAEVTVLFATAIVNARMKVLLGLVAKQLNMMLVAYRALMIVIANVTVLFATVMNTVIITARSDYYCTGILIADYCGQSCSYDSDCEGDCPYCSSDEYGYYFCTGILV
jgi:hypothetical protein